MNKLIDEAQAILAEKGSKLMQDDLNEINDLLVQVDPRTAAWDNVGLVLEGVALVVNDPSYKGDIPPID